MNFCNKCNNMYYIRLSGVSQSVTEGSGESEESEVKIEDGDKTSENNIENREAS